MVCGLMLLEKRGGVALFWSDDVDLRIRSMGNRFIAFEVKESSRDFWRGTGIYGWSESGYKWRTWNLIKELAGDLGAPWLLAGDFNEILFEAEKKGGNACDIDFCGLKDMGFSGYKYTWSNKRGDDNIEERLDRALATEE